MSILNNSLLLGADAGGGAGYQISRSLRFNSSDSAYLSRTPASAGNRKTWTWAGWVKRSALSKTSAENQVLLTAWTATSATGFFQFYFHNGDDATYPAKLTAGTGAATLLTTSQTFRDVAGWYHIVLSVDTTQVTAADRMKIYVNGVQVTQFQINAVSANVSQNSDLGVNAAGIHVIGARTTDGSSFIWHQDGYLADIHFIDGQALTPSSFAETNATTGQWVPKAYTGTFGTNGFWLKFSDNSAATATTLGKDYSGNSNNWTPNNLSVTAGTGNDSLVDTPTSYGTDTGAGGEVRGNYCTWNPVNSSSLLTPANGNLEITGTGAGATYGNSRGSIALNDSKYYWETVVAATRTYQRWGIAPTDTPCENGGSEALGSNDIPNSVGLNCNTGSVSVNSSTVYTGSGALASGAIVGHAFDGTSGKYWISVNGAWLTGNPATNTTPITTVSLTRIWQPAASDATSQTLVANFGQRPFAYTAPSGFKALCDTNLPAPVVAKPSSAFDCVTYTGTGATLTPTSSLGFSPDLVWIKSRSAATDHTIYDAVRGTQARLESNNTDPEVTSDGGLTAFNSNGFTLGTLAQVNTNAATYVAWCWDEAVADGFDIVTYTGNGANRTIAHSLGVAPSFMIVKQRTAASATNWAVWHSSLANTEYLLLNSTAAKATGATYWNSTSPTSTNFSLGTAADVNTNNGTYVAYLWSSVVGYSSFGSYTGNGSSDGPFVYTGFRPRWVMIKNSTSDGGGNSSWLLVDTARGDYNVVNPFLLANTSAAESSVDYLDILSNGFKLRATGDRVNASATYIYAAFAENPFQFARAR